MNAPAPRRTVARHDWVGHVNGDQPHCSKCGQLRSHTNHAPEPDPMPLAPDAVDRALRAHWPSFDRMRPDHQREWRAKMEAALRAALTR